VQRAEASRDRTRHLLSQEGCSPNIAAGVTAMGDYDTLLQEARTRAEAFRSTAKEFIPKLYQALRNENENFSPTDARDRIEKDCHYFWSRRTILEALPDEAKNIEKQKSGRLAQKKQDSAALSAAPLPQITVNVNGEHADERLSLTDEPYPPTCNTSINIKPGDNECSSCQELYYQNIELKEALVKVTKLSTADKELPSISLPASVNDTQNSFDFEFALCFRDVRIQMASMYNQIGDRGKVWFSGKIDRMTGKVIAVKIGRTGDKQQPTTAVDIVN
jgi:hypothetical protein